MPVKAIQLKTIAELSKRIAKTKSGYTLQMDTPSSIAGYYMEQLRHSKEEFLLVAFFDSKCNFLGDVTISKGSVSSAYVSPREIFLQALDHKAVFLVLLHNHPSGNPFPSGPITGTVSPAFNAENSLVPVFSPVTR